MRVDLTKTFSFEAAHLLPRLPDGHKCRRLHGHSFRCDVVVRGDVDPELGWLTDYADIKAVIDPVISQLDHRYLNEIADLDNPTSEQICRWIWQRIAPSLDQLHAVTIHETCNSACTYHGPNPT